MKYHEICLKLLKVLWRKHGHSATSMASVCRTVSLMQAIKSFVELQFFYPDAATHLAELVQTSWYWPKTYLLLWNALSLLLRNKQNKKRKPMQKSKPLFEKRKNKSKKNQTTILKKQKQSKKNKPDIHLYAVAFFCFFARSFFALCFAFCFRFFFSFVFYCFSFSGDLMSGTFEHVNNS